MRPLGGDAFRRPGLLHRAFGADADELVEAAGGKRDLALVQMRDRFHRAIQQAAVMGDHEGRAGKARQPGLQPHRRFQVEVVGRLVQQQQVRVGEQRRGQRDAHAPAAGKLGDRPSLGGLVEPQAGEDGGGARRGGIGADGDQPVMDLGEAVRVGGLGLGQQGQPFGVALQDGVEQGHGPSGASCRTVAMRAREDRRMSPPSIVISPAMARSRVDLPAPLRPTRPMRRPGSIVRSAPFSRVRPPMRMTAPEMTKRDMAGFSAGRRR